MRPCPKLNVAVVAFAAAAALGAHAQQQVQQTGRPFDANPQVGSQGINTYGIGALQDFRAGNAVITGNVGGGRHFRGNIPYGAPGSFGLGLRRGESLPSERLFDFERRSVFSAPSQLNRPYSSSFAGRNDTQIYRSSTQLPAYVTGGQTVAPSNLRSTTGVQVLPEELVRAIKAEPTAAFQQRLGISTNEQGSPYAVTASPLLGLRQEALNPAPFTAPEIEPIRDRAPTPPSQAPVVTQLPKVSDIYKAPAGRTGVRGQAEEAPQRVGMRESLRVEARVNDQGFGTAEGFAGEVGAVRPALLLGNQIQGRVSPITTDQNLGERVATLERQLFGLTSYSQMQPGQDVYLDLLNAAQGRDDQAAKVRPGTEQQRVVREEPAEGEPAERSPFDLALPEPEQMQAMEQRRQAVLDRMEQARAQQREQQRALADRVRETARQVDREMEAEAAGEELQIELPLDAQRAQQSRQALRDLVDQLNYELPPLQTMAGDADRRFNRVIEKAEHELAQGKYFSAEAMYRQALTEAPDNPLIRAGLVHAQLGAGMIRSSAFNLRQVLEEHPELAAARYDPKLLPSEERLKFVQEELQRMISEGQSVPEAGLMTAYIGYQAGSRQLVRYGLAVAQSARAEDPMWPLLRAIWLDEKLPDADVPAGAGEPDAQADRPVAPITK